MEIKCDLDVTDNRANECNLEYLTTIVTMLMNASTNRAAATFYGTTALVSQKYEPEIIERFKIVSGYNHHKKHLIYRFMIFDIYYAYFISIFLNNRTLLN